MASHSGGLFFPECRIVFTRNESVWAGTIVRIVRRIEEFGKIEARAAVKA